MVLLGGGLDVNCCHPTLMLSLSPPDGQRDQTKTHTGRKIDSKDFYTRKLVEAEQKAEACSAHSRVNFVMCP